MTSHSVTTFSTHVLIVDDDPDIREALGDLLEHEGYQVHAVEKGEEAIQQVRQTQYGAALLDMQLPDLHGLSVLNFLMQLDPKLPIIVLTAHDVKENTIGSLTRGAFAYLMKPYNSEEVKATVRRAVSVKAISVKAEHVALALSESEERFRSVVESSPDAIILADETGMIISLNKGAQRLFSYGEEELLGKPLTVLMPTRHRDAHQRGLERVRSTGATRVIGKTVELHGLRKDGSEFPLELSLSTWKTKSGIFYSGIIRDITERKRAENRQATQLAVSLILAESGTLSEVAPRLLQAICDTAGWEVGVIWLVDRDVKELRCETLWHEPAVPVEEFAAHTREITFGPGIGLPGRIWSSGEPAWLVDILKDPNFPRAPSAAKAGLHGAFGFPIRGRSEIHGVIEFFSRGIRQPDNDLLKMMADIGIKIGQFVERKRAEAALRESQEQFRQLAENIREVFWMTDPEKNRMIYISPGYEDIWGRSCESLYASPRSWLEAIHPDDRDRVLASALTKQVGGEYDEEYRIVRPDGLIRWIQDRAFPIRDRSGAVYRIAGIAEDISERVQAQEALRNAYGKIDAILSGLPCSIVIVDEHRQILYANTLATERFGTGGQPLAGRLLHQTIPIHFSQRQPFRDEHGVAGSPSLPQHGEGEFEMEHAVYRYRLFPVVLRSGQQQTGMVIWDITEQQQLQDQLIQAEKLSSLGTLVSGMAHEINNPMQGILGMAQIILDENDPGKIKEYAQDIAGYAQHVATVVRDFACYARPSSRDGEVETDICERLHEAVKMVRRGPQFGHIEVVTELQPVPRFRARRSEIEQVFVNLISNAVDAMQGNGRLTLATRSEGGLITVLISDTGRGIPKVLMGKILDPFFTTKDPGKGTGLGLSIAHKIVTKYEGTMNVESEEGHGTTFTV
ncbi:MAG: PAS domain S-box protein, partial [Nitrospirae bacterium]|nr:PAS domain S-box protein [Nitrospirota bacterium]